jgi:hypothetical protein
VIVWLPGERAVVDNVATPLAFSVTGPVPRVVVPSRKVTVPVGVPVAGATAVTVAVKVTDWPSDDGFKLEVSPTAALPWLTTWVTALDVAAVKLAFPE